MLLIVPLSEVKCYVLVLSFHSTKKACSLKYNIKKDIFICLGQNWNYLSRAGGEYSPPFLLAYTTGTQGCFTKTSLVNLWNKCYDRFSGFIKFWFSKRNTEITMSNLYLIEKVIILKKIQVTMKTLAPTFFNHYSLTLRRKKHAVMRAIRKKLNIFTLQLLIYYILE